MSGFSGCGKTENLSRVVMLFCFQAARCLPQREQPWEMEALSERELPRGGGVKSESSLANAMVKIQGSALRSGFCGYGILVGLTVWGSRLKVWKIQGQREGGSPQNMDQIHGGVKPDIS